MFVGALLGSRVVQYAHSHEKNWFDRLLSGATVMPSDGGVLVMVTTQR